MPEARRRPGVCAEPTVRFLCSVLANGRAGLPLGDDNLIVITVALTSDRPGEVSIFLEPECN